VVVPGRMETLSSYPLENGYFDSKLAKFGPSPQSDRFHNQATCHHLHASLGWGATSRLPRETIRCCPLNGEGYIRATPPWPGLNAMDVVWKPHELTWVSTNVVAARLTDESSGPHGEGYGGRRGVVFRRQT
jgi:hypothetical protein